MATLHFFATAQDCDELWNILFAEMRLSAFPDPWFGDLPAPTLTNQAEVAANLNRYLHVAPGLSYFLTSDDWSVEPLVYHSCSNNPNFTPHWYVSQRHGGPSIHFVPSYAYPWHMKSEQIVSGVFSDYPYYYSVTDSGQVIERPDGLARAMKTIRRRLLSHGKAVRAASRERAIAMRHAMTAHQQGTVLRQGDIVFAPLLSQGSNERQTRST